MNSIIKKAAAIALAAALTTGAMPPGAGGGLLQKPANEAYAADAYTFDESTGLLTLKGTINYGVSEKIGDYRDKVKKVIAEEGTEIIYGYGLFSYFVNCTEIDLSKADTSSCTDFTRMFLNCTSLEKLDISKADMSSCSNFAAMFYFCTSLKKLDLSGWTSFPSAQSVMSKKRAAATPLSTAASAPLR